MMPILAMNPGLLKPQVPTNCRRNRRLDSRRNGCGRSASGRSASCPACCFAGCLTCKGFAGARMRVLVGGESVRRAMGLPTRQSAIQQTRQSALQPQGWRPSRLGSTRIGCPACGFVPRPRDLTCKGFAGARMGVQSGDPSGGRWACRLGSRRNSRLGSLRHDRGGSGWFVWTGWRVRRTVGLPTGQSAIDSLAPAPSVLRTFALRANSFRRAPCGSSQQTGQSALQPQGWRSSQLSKSIRILATYRKLF